MNNILEFLENNYIWFLVAAAVLLFALVGFIVDSKRKQKKMEGNFEGTPNNNGLTTAPNEVPTETLEMATPVETVPEATAVAEEVKAPFEPVTESPEVLDLNANTSNEMTFNDIPTPQENNVRVEEAPIKDEIIEPFNIGSPVEAPVQNTNVNPEPVVSEPVVPTPTVNETPVLEPTVNETPIEPTPVTNITNDQEPVVNIQE